MQVEPLRHHLMAPGVCPCQKTFPQEQACYLQVYSTPLERQTYQWEVRNKPEGAAGEGGGVILCIRSSHCLKVFVRLGSVNSP